MSTIPSRKDIVDITEQIFRDEPEIVLMGDFTHGTKECHIFRAELTKYLIENHHVRCIVVEWDVQDIIECNKYIHDTTSYTNADDLLIDNITRWPYFMWCHQQFADMLDWLLEWNLSVSRSEDTVQIYGMDLYGKDKVIPSEDIEEENQELAIINRKIQKRLLDKNDTDAGWNQRDSHMAKVIRTIREDYRAEDIMVVWAHNNHVIKKLKFGKTVGSILNKQYSIFSIATCGKSGKFITASEWDSSEVIENLPKITKNSWEEALLDKRKNNKSCVPSCTYRLRDMGAVTDIKDKIDDQLTTIPTQFDIIYHINQTSPIDVL